jgi:branched-chain amino acid transport system substrate-binding protein
MLRGIIAACLVLAGLANPASGQPVRIGFLSTMSGPQGLLGEEILNGFRLAMTQRDGKLGGSEVTLLVGDDQLKPEIGRQLAAQMIERDHADLITGILNSAVLLAIARPVMDAGKLLISSNAGPSQLAGAQCQPNFFDVAAQNDASPQAMGSYLQAQGVRRVFLLAPNYQAGKDKMAGFKRSFRGEIVGEVYTPFDQLDYAGQIAQIRLANPDALFQFLPGATGIAFLKQWHQSGVDRSVKLYTDRGGMDETMLGAVGDAANGAATASSWSNTMTNPENLRFVHDYEQSYHRPPSLFAAQGYDTALLLDAAIAENHGRTDDSDALRRALLHAQAPSVRGHPIKFGHNHFPTDDYYLMTVEQTADGHHQLSTGALIVAQQPDAYAEQCKMTAE